MVPGSSTDISEDWEKDFDLDMTEEEVQMALSKVDASGEVSRPGWLQKQAQQSHGLRTLPTKPNCPLRVDPYAYLKWQAMGKKAGTSTQTLSSCHQ